MEETVTGNHIPTTTMNDLFISLGTEALTLCPKKNHSEEHCNFCMMTTSYASPTATPSWVGDYIGAESCYDLQNDNTRTEDVSGDGDRGGVMIIKREMMKRKREEEVVPPPLPLPLLARTENHSSRMPWVLNRYYTEDGRLILREEKVKHHEYFEVHRSNGRLTLHLIPLMDDDDDDVEEEDDDSKINNGVEELMGKCSIGIANEYGMAAAAN